MARTSGGSGGGGGGFPDHTGDGSPLGVVTAPVGSSYVDTTNGALYWKIENSDATGWSLFGEGKGDVPGAFAVGDGNLSYVFSTGEPAGSLTLTDLLAYVGTGNGVSWNTAGVDGDQSFSIELGDSGQFNHYFAPDGSFTVAGVFFPVQATTVGAPAYVKGGMYFDTTLNKLRIGGASGWETVTSA